MKNQILKVFTFVLLISFIALPPIGTIPAQAVEQRPVASKTKNHVFFKDQSVTTLIGDDELFGLLNLRREKVAIPADVEAPVCLNVDPEILEKALRHDSAGTETLKLINSYEESIDFTLIEIDDEYSPLLGEPDMQHSSHLEYEVITLSNTESYNSQPNTGYREADVELILDDGTRENGIGIIDDLEFIFLNRFTPDPGVYPFTLNKIQVYFASSDNVQVGDRMDLVVYENTSGNTDPAVGANFLARFPVTVQALDAWNTYLLPGWNTYPLPGGVVLDGPGDVLIGVIAMEARGANYYPAALDQTSSQRRSWAGWWKNSPPPDEPTLPPDDTWTLIDNFYPGNWMIRGISFKPKINFLPLILR